MCDIKYLQNRVRTWYLLLQLDHIEMDDYNTRVANLQSRTAVLEAEYSLLLTEMKKEYENAKGISTDSITSRNKRGTT